MKQVKRWAVVVMAALSLSMVMFMVVWPVIDYMLGVRANPKHPVAEYAMLITLDTLICGVMGALGVSLLKSEDIW